MCIFVEAIIIKNVSSLEYAVTSHGTPEPLCDAAGENVSSWDFSGSSLSRCQSRGSVGRFLPNFFVSFHEKETTHQPGANEKSWTFLCMENIRSLIRGACPIFVKWIDFFFNRQKNRREINELSGKSVSAGKIHVSSVKWGNFTKRGNVALKPSTFVEEKADVKLWTRFLKWRRRFCKNWGEIVKLQTRTESLWPQSRQQTQKK